MAWDVLRTDTLFTPAPFKGTRVFLLLVRGGCTKDDVSNTAWSLSIQSVKFLASWTQGYRSSTLMPTTTHIRILSSLSCASGLGSTALFRTWTHWADDNDNKEDSTFGSSPCKLIVHLRPSSPTLLTHWGKTSVFRESSSASGMCSFPPHVSSSACCFSHRASSECQPLREFQGPPFELSGVPAARLLLRLSSWPLATLTPRLPWPLNDTT